MKHYIGIDVSKRDFHACFSENGDVTKKYFQRIFSKKTIGGETLPRSSLRGDAQNGTCYFCRLEAPNSIH